MNDTLFKLIQYLRTFSYYKWILLFIIIVKQYIDEMRLMPKWDGYNKGYGYVRFYILIC